MTKVYSQLLCTVKKEKKERKFNIFIYMIYLFLTFFFFLEKNYILFKHITIRAHNAINKIYRNSGNVVLCRIFNANSPLGNF